MNANEFAKFYNDCPWMVTNSEYAEACTKALREGDLKGLEALSAFGRKNGPFAQTLPAPALDSVAAIKAATKSRGGE